MSYFARVIERIIKNHLHDVSCVIKRRVNKMQFGVSRRSKPLQTYPEVTNSRVRADAGSPKVSFENDTVVRLKARS